MISSVTRASSSPLVDCKAAGSVTLSLLWGTQQHGLWAAGCLIVAGGSVPEGQWLQSLPKPAGLHCEALLQHCCL